MVSHAQRERGENRSSCVKLVVWPPFVTGGVARLTGYQSCGKRNYTEKVRPFYNMRTTSVDEGSGEFTWCIFLVLALLPLYPDISIIDPFHDSPYNFSFHNYGNRLTWPPRRLHPSSSLLVGLLIDWLVGLSVIIS